MNLSVKAMVLNVMPAGEADRLCVLLTDRLGIVRAFAKGARRIKNKNFASTMQFVYGGFQLFEHKDRYYIDEADHEELFLALRDDIEGLALAQYLCELAMELTPPDSGGEVYLRLMRAALYCLSRRQHPAALIKAAAETRMLSLAGYQPDLTMCQGCGRYEADTMYFMLRSGILRCGDCGPEASEPFARLGRGAMAALRHAAYAELRSLFSFELGEESARQLSAACESYLLENIEHSFVTLDFYKSLLRTSSDGQ